MTRTQTVLSTRPLAAPSKASLRLPERGQQPLEQRRREGLLAYSGCPASHAPSCPSSPDVTEQRFPQVSFHKSSYLSHLLYSQGENVGDDDPFLCGRPALHLHQHDVVEQHQVPNVSQLQGNIVHALAAAARQPWPGRAAATRAGQDKGSYRHAWSLLEDIIKTAILRITKMQPLLWPLLGPCVLLLCAQVL